LLMIFVVWVHADGQSTASAKIATNAKNPKNADRLFVALIAPPFRTGMREKQGV
jgi:hypothetical protein